MAWHRLKLYYLKIRQKLLIYFLTMFLIISTIMGMWLLAITRQSQSEIERNQEQIERLLKGLSCVLLISPEKRTKDNVTQCININASDQLNSDFIFDTLDSKIVEKADPNFIPLLKKELKGDPGPTGLQGETGLEGEPGQQGPSGEKGSDGQLGEPGQNGEKGDQGEPGDPGADGKEVEFRYNDKKDRIEWRYIGDINWQVLVKACMLIDSCEEIE